MVTWVVQGRGMQRLWIGSGLLALSRVAGEHAGIRSLWGEMETVARRFGLHAGVRAGSVSRAWLRQYDVENDKRGDDP